MDGPAHRTLERALEIMGTKERLAEALGTPVADIEEGHISTASCILANLSMKVGRPLVYDPKKRQILDDPEANALLQRPYRQPWVHPDPTKV